MRREWDWDWLTFGWILWVASFFFLEGVALFLEARGKVRDETLSDHIWWIRDNGPSLILFLVVAVVLWLGYHFTLEGKTVVP